MRLEGQPRSDRLAVACRVVVCCVGCDDEMAAGFERSAETRWVPDGKARGVAKPLVAILGGVTDWEVLSKRDNGWGEREERLTAVELLGGVINVDVSPLAVFRAGKVLVRSESVLGRFMLWGGEEEEGLHHRYFQHPRQSHSGPPQTQSHFANHRQTSPPQCCSCSPRPAPCSHQRP